MDIVFNDEENVLTINNWEIQDPEIIEAITDHKNDDDWIKGYLYRILRIGAVALKGAKLSEQVDYVQKRFDKISTEFDKLFINYSDSIEEKFKEHYNNFVEIINGKEGIKECIDDHFGDKGKVKEIIKDFFGENGEIRKLFNLELDSSPLHLIKKEFLEQVNDLKVAFKGYFTTKETEEKIKEQTTLKGYDYEDQVEYILNNISKTYGDIIKPVQTKSSKSSGKKKKGDFLVEIHDGLNKDPIIFTIEAKTGGISLKGTGKNAILNILDKSMLERKAQYAIGVLRNIESLPETFRPTIGVFREYGTDKIVCVANVDNWLPLEISYKIVRSKLLFAQKIGTGFDSETFKTKIAKVINLLKKISTIRGSLTTIIKSTKDVQGDLDKLKTSIQSELTEIQNELRSI